MADRHVDSVVVDNDGMFSGNASAVAVMATARRLPSAGEAEFPKRYGRNFVEMLRRSAYSSTRLLKVPNQAISLSSVQPGGWFAALRESAVDKTFRRGQPLADDCGAARIQPCGWPRELWHQPS